MENATAVKLEISKEFNVPSSRLYKAWNEENDLKQWWQPMGNKLDQMENELRQGGRIRYVFVTGNGEQAFTIEGEYKEVEEGKHLVYSWNWLLPVPTVHDTHFQLDIRFEEMGNGSAIQISQEQFSNEESVQPHRQGWEDALNNLKRYLEQGA